MALAVYTLKEVFIFTSPNQKNSQKSRRIIYPSDITMPGDDAGMEMEAMTESVLRRATGDSGANNGLIPDAHPDSQGVRPGSGSV